MKFEYTKPIPAPLDQAFKTVKSSRGPRAVNLKYGKYSEYWSKLFTLSLNVPPSVYNP